MLYLACALLLAGVGLWWWSRRPLSARRGPDVIVLVTIDTLRADHLGCYGYPRNTSPFIDRLAAKSTRFTAAFAPTATTAASHASLFTSLYPLQHNVRKNGEVLDDSFLTLAELLRTAGYDTAGFVSTNRHFRAGNQHQGFDTFDEPDDLVALSRVGDQTVARAIAWLSQRPSERRLFLWIHLFDPHQPYNPSRRFPLESADASERLVHFLIEQHHVDFEFFRQSESAMLDVIDGYDGEVTAADQAIQHLFEYVEGKFAATERLWIVTSDHGEGLGNHRWPEHGKMIYNEQLHIPLLLYSSSRAFADPVVDRVVENVDILPTIAGLVGSSVPHSVAPMQGTSLLPLLLGQSDKFPFKYAFAQRRDFDPRKRPPRIIPEESNYEEGEKYALQDGRHKYILRTVGADEFYHLRDDPYEVRNLINSPSADKERLHDALVAKIALLKRTAVGTPRAVDEQTKERLRALGYEP